MTRDLQSAARLTTAADAEPEGDGLNAARGIIRGFLWSLPAWLLFAWWWLG